MNKVQIFCEQLEKQLSQNNRQKGIKLSCKVGEEKDSETFSCHYSRGHLHLEAANPLAAAFGWHHLGFALASDHTAEFMRQQQPRLVLRPLWLDSDQDVFITSQLSVGLPNAVRSEVSLDDTCRRIIALGYNAVILGRRQHRDISPPLERAADFQAICTHFQQYSLKVIVRTNFITSSITSYSPVDSDFKTQCHQIFGKFNQDFPNIDYLLWESNLYHPSYYRNPAAEGLTQKELLLEEILLLESAINKKGLIFFVPTQCHNAEQQAKWLPALCNEVNENTVIAFSSVAGDPCDDHLLPHPLWNELRKLPDTSTLPLLPIINAGANRHRKSIWPLTFDSGELYLNRCIAHHFVGAIFLVDDLLEKNCFSEANLWALSQQLWSKKSFDMLLESWFQVNMPEINYRKYLKYLRQLRAISVELSHVQALCEVEKPIASAREENRELAESLVAQLDCLHTLLQHAHAKLKDPFLQFAAESKHVIQHLANIYHFSLPLTKKLFK